MTLALAFSGHGILMVLLATTVTPVAAVETMRANVRRRVCGAHAEVLGVRLVIAEGGSEQNSFLIQRFQIRGGDGVDVIGVVDDLHAEGLVQTVKGLEEDQLQESSVKRNLVLGEETNLFPPH